MKNKTPLGIFLVIMACLCWALDAYYRYPLMKNNLKAEWLVFAEHSFLILIFFYPIMSGLINLIQNATSGIWISFLMIGALGSALATVFFSKAMFLLNPSIVIVLQKLQPIVALLLAKILLKEKLPWHFLLVALLAIIGVVLLTYNDFVQIDFNSISNDSNHIIYGYLFAFLSVIGWASATIFAKKIFNQTAHYLGVYQVLGVRYFLGWLALLVYLEFFEGSEWDPIYNVLQPHVFSIFMMVMISAVIGMSFYYQGMKILRSRIIVIAELWYPFLAILINLWLLKIHLDWVQILGASILVMATYLVQIKKE